jgi:hypothetical protein
MKQRGSSPGRSVSEAGAADLCEATVSEVHVAFAAWRQGGVFGVGVRATRRNSGLVTSIASPNVF